MLLDDDLTVNKSVEKTLNNRKKLKRDIKHYISYAFSQNQQFVQTIKFRNIRDNDDVASFKVESNVDKFGIHNQYKGKVKEKTINKITIMIISDRLLDKAYNYFTEHNLAIENYKIDYQSER